MCILVSQRNLEHAIYALECNEIQFCLNSNTTGNISKYVCLHPKIKFMQNCGLTPC